MRREGKGMTAVSVPAVPNSGVTTGLVPFSTIGLDAAVELGEFALSGNLIGHEAPVGLGGIGLSGYRHAELPDALLQVARSKRRVNGLVQNRDDRGRRIARRRN